MDSLLDLDRLNDTRHVLLKADEALERLIFDLKIYINNPLLYRSLLKDIREAAKIDNRYQHYVDWLWDDV